MPFISQVAVGRREKLSIYGNDYHTEDGTGVRDYLHVVDLAAGHVKALEKLDTLMGAEAINLGTGRGCSVLELIASFSRAAGKDIPYDMVSRRAGDVAMLVANSEYAYKKLGWQSTHTLDDMTADTWNWQKKNPQGYQ